MAKFTLDDIRAAAEEKYGSTDIEFGEDTLVLRNVLRLPKAERKELTTLQDRIDAGEDQEELVAGALKLVAEDKKVAERFLKAVGDDMAVLSEVFASYTAGTQVGEA